MFVDPDFADFCQEIGLASLGASDEDLKRLASCFWFTVEYGLVRNPSDPKSVKAYGAGLLSSFGELEHACKDNTYTFRPQKAGSKSTKPSEQEDPAPQFRADGSQKPLLLPWDPAVASTTEYPICDYNPKYFVAESMADAKLKMRAFCQRMQKPFHARFNPLTNSIWVDRAVKPVQETSE
jgi:phenylalanine-4-hydroxylase